MVVLGCGRCHHSLMFHQGSADASTDDGWQKQSLVTFSTRVLSGAQSGVGEYC